MQASIIDKIREGDEVAYEQLFRDYYEQLCLYACKYIGEMEQAEEIVQDYFVQLWEKRDGLQVHSSLKSYLFGAIRNNCLSYFKHQKVRENHRQEVLNTSSEAYSDEEDMSAFEMEQRIHNCINGLPEQRQRIFKMSKFEGLKYKEIAESLGLSVKTVEAQMGKALKTLRTELAGALPILLLILYFFKK
ncbi:RNA polymerase sigma-70 factor [Sediminitomix flava]|uniref:RNA polymerase sigma-70 factor (ECF subfamily) n=1 Tax=Sediminitomix flava TaxID=379075 RepID=A0A315ZH69_SEDFL|nr:RNA polymerase sigma-70 factor [Sediminitomix flava]PWJ44926.1 RNA polymerase sigma-70 factor (ECF subfamily) [Sediminitomix flava]